MMNKKTVVELYKENFDDVLERNDLGEIRLTWNNLLDHLEKEREISRARANTWVNPFDKNRK